MEAFVSAGPEFVMSGSEGLIGGSGALDFLIAGKEVAGCDGAAADSPGAGRGCCYCVSTSWPSRL